MDSNRIKLALEPEAASILCRFSYPNLKQYLSTRGKQYMVADLGGTYQLQIRFLSKYAFK